MSWTSISVGLPWATWRSPSGLLDQVCPWWDPTTMLASRGVRSEHGGPQMDWLNCISVNMLKAQVFFSRCLNHYARMFMSNQPWKGSAESFPQFARMWHDVCRQDMKRSEPWGPGCQTVSEVTDGIWNCWIIEVNPRVKHSTYGQWDFLLQSFQIQLRRHAVSQCMM